MRNSRYRFLMIKIIAFVMFVLIAVRLFSMQIIDGEVYNETATSRVSTSIRTKAPRGDILDKYGKVLVTNKIGYSIQLQKTSSDDAVINNTLGEVADILIKTDGTAVNTIPVSVESPYKFEFEDENDNGKVSDEKAKWFRNNKYAKDRIKPSMSAEKVIKCRREL